jgi:hypothetical protein
MERVCVFCGRSFTGQKKNREHLISDWLVDEADLRKRTMTVDIGDRTFNAAMSRIVGDACEKCNSLYSDLEGAAKTAFIKIKSGQDLDQADGRALLDWLDKVRSGMWLWLLRAGGTKFGVRPKFMIDARIGRKDRVALIARYPEDTTMRGLAFWGLGISFLYMPSALGLLINNVAIVTLSIDFLLARHLRDVLIKWEMNDKLLQIVDLKRADGNDHAPRLSLLGSPYIIGQCIGPRELQNELTLDDMCAKARHLSLLETDVMRLDAHLQKITGPLGRVRELSVNTDAHIALMEINVCLASAFMLREFLSSDFSTVTDKRKLEQNLSLYNDFLAAERDHVEALRARYKSIMGIDLPLSL